MYLNHRKTKKTNILSVRGCWLSSCLLSAAQQYSKSFNRFEWRRTAAGICCCSYYYIKQNRLIKKLTNKSENPFDGEKTGKQIEQQLLSTFQPIFIHRIFSFFFFFL